MKREVDKKRAKNETKLEARTFNVCNGLRKLIFKAILRIYDSSLDQRIANALVTARSRGV